MTTTRRRCVVAPLVLVLLLALGAGVAAGIGSFLGISFEPTEQMDVPEATVPEVAPPVTNPLLTVRGPGTVRLGVAVEELAAAQRDATLRGTATVEIEAGAADDEDDSYAVGGTRRAMTVTAAGEAGAARAVYDLAAAQREGRDVAEHLGEEVPASRLGFRMVDLGAVGVTPDPAQWASGDDYSHVSRAFEDAYLPDAPYVDEQELASDYEEWDAFLRQSLANGYNAVAWPGFLEYVDLTDAGVYPAGDPHVARARALRAAFEPFWDRAHELGMKVFLRTDMLALTPALQASFDERFGGADTEDPALWEVYTDALDRLYASAPSLSGVLIRIGEGGSIYQEPGWDYYSSLAVRSVEAVRTMLTAFTDQAEASGREVVFRTWSVGIGDVGDMHTDPASYDAVLDGLDSPALIVSTKYTAGDFYSFLPLNTTLEGGDQRRIVEFQARREFEAFGSFPNDLGPELSWAVQQLLAANPRIEGVWSWTQDGGPWRAGPMTLYLQSGFWQLYELDNRIAAAVARDPDVDPGQVTVDWARRYLSTDPATVEAVAEAMTLSRDAIRRGLYLRPFAEQRVVALGLEPPPQMWLFEWDILTGDSATLDLLYAVVADRLDETIQDGEDAVADARRMRDLVAGTDPSTWRDGMREQMLATLDYEVDTLTLLSAYRTMFLRAAAWHDTGEGYDAWLSARDAYVSAAAVHVQRHTGDVEHPAWNLTAAELGLQRAERDLAMAWAARILLVLALGWVLLGLRLPTARVAVLAAVLPWRATQVAARLGRGGLLLAVAVPAALTVLTRGVQTSFLAPAHLLVTLGALTLFVTAAAVRGTRRGARAVLLVVAGVSLLRCLLVLAVLARTGPGGYWFGFWTSPGARTLYVTVAFALFAWMLVAVGWALAPVLGRRRSTATVLESVGIVLALGGGSVASYGLEEALTVWNDQLGLLPWGLARILGITTYLEIPESLAAWVALVGLALVVGGLLVRLRRRTVPA